MTRRNLLRNVMAKRSLVNQMGTQRRRIEELSRLDVSPERLEGIQLKGGTLQDVKVLEGGKETPLRASPVNIKEGQYVGDGSTGLKIGVGFRPKYVRIWHQKTAEDLAPDSDTVLETTGKMVDDNVNGIAFAPVGGDFLDTRIIAINNSGFEVSDDGSDAHPNTTSEVYNWLALG